MCASAKRWLQMDSSIFPGKNNSKKNKSGSFDLNSSEEVNRPMNNYMILLNSNIIFKIIHKDEDFHVFQQKLAEAIIEKNKSISNTRHYTSMPSLPLSFTGQHFQIPIETTS
ncbi:hypothetical protein CDAR_96941 [Caerostris darwini]|uniref:Uncharacterized protein n=1 Tax=Caerostris darwini TaxID=1538125 RepID=A0AAV4SGJ0_9ARAC|nr:hypothetical protein CDAR_96941 [Caerostris darwini]